MPAGQRKSAQTNDDSDSGASGVGGLAEEAMERIEDVAGSVAAHARRAGATARGIEARLGERPWTLALAAAAVIGVLGFLVGSRRRGRY